jgi:predicted small lipoprotein YifL
MKIILNSVFILAVVGCGIKGDPLPPAVEETVQKQSAMPPEMKKQSTDIPAPVSDSANKKKQQQK